MNNKGKAVGTQVRLTHEHARYGHGIIEGVQRYGHPSMSPGWTQPVYTIRKIVQDENTGDWQRTGVMIYMVPDCDTQPLEQHGQEANL